MCRRILVTLQRKMCWGGELSVYSPSHRHGFSMLNRLLMTSKHVWSPHSAQLLHKDKYASKHVQLIISAKSGVSKKHLQLPVYHPVHSSLIQLRQRRSSDQCDISNRRGHQPPWRHGQGDHSGHRVVQPRRRCQHHFKSVLHWLVLHHGSR